MRDTFSITFLAVFIVAGCANLDDAKTGITGGNSTSPESQLTRLKSGSDLASTNSRPIVPVIGPLLQTRWGQDGAYQTQTPYKDGEATYPGCTTVASAQVLYYYQYRDRAESPVEYVLEHSPLEGNGVTDDGYSLFLDLPNYRHDYSQMALSLDNATPAQIEATATFIFHVGATMNAQFGGGEGSSATGRQIENAFRYQWGFNNISRRKMSIIAKDGFQYTDDEWADLMRSELMAGRPVLYMAQQENGDAGHAFVIDGYENNGKVHVNFGWGGRADGWYDPNTLEDPYGRRWNRNPLIFRGLEPEEGYAKGVEVRVPQTNRPAPANYSWNGNSSLISFTSDNDTGYGLTVDEGVLHPTSPASPVVFLQWEVDRRDGDRLRISAEGAGPATITYGVWNDRSQDRTYRDVTLPFVLDPAADGLSANDGDYYVVAVAFADAPVSSVAVIAEPTKELGSAVTSREASPITVDGFTWNGNGSLISLASDTKTGYGLTVDEATIHPSSQDNPAVFFQWEIDGRDGRRVRIDADGMRTATIRYGDWSDRSADVTRTVELPYVVDPAADGLSNEDGGYFVLMVSFDTKPAQSTSVVATIIE